MEKYSEDATVVSAILNMWRTSGGFAVGFFQPPWLAKDGAAVVFSTQAAIVVAMTILSNGFTIWLGRRST